MRRFGRPWSRSGVPGRRTAPRAGLASLVARLALCAGLVVALAGTACGPDGPPDGVLRIGCFPNVTHAQALVARQLERKGTPWFAPRLGVKVEWVTFNAGPSAMEALLSGAIDATYVGPNPALNAHIRSRGDEVRVLAGAASGGAALVVRRGAGLRGPADFRGRTIATPQLGNTQDVACRAWLAAGGLKVTVTGGDASVVPTANPDQLARFVAKELDAAWTVEPWVSRLEREADGEILVPEPDALTTVLVASRALVERRGALAKALVAAHAELTTWVVAHPEEARVLVGAELLALTRQPIAPDLLAHAWPRLRFEHAIDRARFERLVTTAQGVGFLADAIPLDRLVVAP
ncbi:MAG: ABC transporter substrate-binding protein [Planctomycetia bacterium]|nr:ABC transporter substrate-binding protein [Planctomycetia bacterium]